MLEAHAVELRNLLPERRRDRLERGPRLKYHPRPRNSHLDRCLLARLKNQSLSVALLDIVSIVVRRENSGNGRGSLTRIREYSGAKAGFCVWSRTASMPLT